MVGMTGFEPATFWSRTRRATKLRYIPTLYILTPQMSLGKGKQACVMQACRHMTQATVSGEAVSYSP